MRGQFPTSIRAGVTFDHTFRLNQYEAPAWALSVLLRGPKAINISSVAADNGAHEAQAAATTTATWPAGEYIYSVRVTSGDTVLEVASGLVTVEADLAAMPDGGDARSHAQRTLDALEAVIEKRATRDQERYTINNRELWRTPIGDLLKLRDYYRAELRRMKATQRGSLFGCQVRVRF
ncbi:hypothetical protein [Burkholderia stagnalis]|uniref:hypothetical protein n=1 Tax=Burkholderia stagnalis TaxID=1503054 RepID=UPI000F56CF8D|nr:hypothetical protein [Burkholderia stagnalis]RQQ37071.1 hypothetical protein DF163_01500 [Burkholderia stagnalis]RQQ55642.1 hypothetical protein DF162_01695 [Burkholderia stagnalis]RQY19103.1 hypothetical protein DF118_01700 [Burkholderia stagnalis]RQY64212.1 hypothetical protein DF112_00510 [Burkholderia stagnalis]RQY70399.1 hypothetical protein DF109_02330 [Burkholderia stagnalis]